MRTLLSLLLLAGCSSSVLDADWGLERIDHPDGTSEQEPFHFEEEGETWRRTVHLIFSFSEYVEDVRHISLIQETGEDPQYGGGRYPLIWERTGNHQWSMAHDDGSWEAECWLGEETWKIDRQVLNELYCEQPDGTVEYYLEGFEMDD